MFAWTIKTLLKKAARAEKEYAARTKGEVPPLAGGDLFTSLFEGATAFRVISCDASTGSCLVEFSHAETGKGPKPFKWKDRIRLVRGRNGWLVDDIEYLGNWQFMHKGQLKKLLEQIIVEGSRK